jgi:hypothetical protein
MPLAALFGCPSLARPSHCAPEALRCVVGGATMAIPGGACTTLRTAHCCTHVLGSPVSLIGSELPWLTGSDPSLCPGPMPQGVSYVHHANLYIRNIIPIRAPVGLSRVQSKPLPGRAWTPHPSARPGLFHPTSGKRNSTKFALARSRASNRRGPKKGSLIRIASGRGS